MDKIFQQIIDLAVWAPSGDNSQPWNFKFGDGKLKVFNIPNRDNPVLNFQNSGSYIAHGALIENISLSAKRLGYEAAISLFPKTEQPELVAEISLNKTDLPVEKIEQFIEKRHTNRRPHKPNPIDERVLDSLRQAGNEELGKLALVTDRDKISKISSGLSAMEKIALENKGLHQLFFSDILWTEKENQTGKPGLFIKTLEVPLPTKIIFKILKFWSITRLANMIGFSRLASKGNAKLYSQSGAYALILPHKDNAESFVNAGRLMQRVWLGATLLGLSVQPVTGILFMARRFLTGDIGNFSQRHVNQAILSYKTIKSLAGIADEDSIAMLLRVGYADPASARSQRMKPIIVFGEKL